MRALPLLLLVACTTAAPASDAGAPEHDAGAPADAGEDAGVPDAGLPVSCDDKARACASQFGALFTKANGRADGTLVAVVRPVDTQCTAPNGTHVVLQLRMLGQVQRLVASVDGIGATTVHAPLKGVPWSEGWHVTDTLDYPTDFAVHSSDFTDLAQNAAVDFICEKLELGAPVSVYAYSDGTSPSSAHQIHFVDRYPDGAIVVNPTSANPTWLLFRYPNQVF